MEQGDWPPLPLGGNIVRKDLGESICEQICDDIKRSIEFSLENPEDALKDAIKWGRGIDEETNEEFVKMYVNKRTIDYGEDGRRAVRMFLERGAELGLVRGDFDASGLKFIGAGSMTDRPDVSEFGSVDPAPPASHEETVEKLRDTLCDEEEKMFQRMRALFALRNIGGKPAVDSLAKAFDSNSALLKHEIAYVLGQMQDDNAVPYLIERLEDLEEDVMVRHEAAEALALLGTGLPWALWKGSRQMKRWSLQNPAK